MAVCTIDTAHSRRNNVLAHRRVHARVARVRAKHVAVEAKLQRRRLGRSRSRRRCSPSSKACRIRIRGSAGRGRGGREHLRDGGGLLVQVPRLGLAALAFGRGQRAETHADANVLLGHVGSTGSCKRVF